MSIAGFGTAALRSAVDPANGRPPQITRVSTRRFTAHLLFEEGRCKCTRPVA